MSENQQLETENRDAYKLKEEIVKLTQERDAYKKKLDEFQSHLKEAEVGILNAHSCRGAQVMWALIGTF